MLYYRPHTATVAAVAATTVSDEVTGYSRSGSTSIRGQLTEKTPMDAMREWGLEVMNPAVWLCNLADADSIKVGDTITVNTRVYYVLSGPQLMDAEPRTSHAKYLVRRND